MDIYEEISFLVNNADYITFHEVTLHPSDLILYEEITLQCDSEDQYNSQNRTNTLDDSPYWGRSKHHEQYFNDTY